MIAPPPVVEVAEQHGGPRDRAPVIEQPDPLRRALLVLEPEVRRDDADDSLVEADVDVDRATRFAVRHTEVDPPHRLDGPAGEDAVAERPASALPRRSLDAHRIARRRRERG